ncbi:enterochelin esterase [Enterobacteriaceae bacterium YMB-R22]|uniref:enterochelin esterase n=1 Tax=Tenebrionicola larvae TaxID=2815733 RepID=UPI0021E154D3|nr:enterochelin esterase [Tenebrionicola larvae]MBV4413862.1 enterochelin esterase [Tenebrionicola larvae]
MSELQPGTQGWWQVVQQQGVPAVTRLSPDRCAVTFYWRDPGGCARTSSVRRVWIYITGVTDHHLCSQPVSLERVPGTDVWQWSTQLPSTWRGSYCFIPSSSENDFAPQASCAAPDMQALRESWSRLLPHAVADPFNPHSWRGGRDHPGCALHLPDAPVQPGWEARHPAAAAPLCITWQSQRLQNRRRIWIFSTGEQYPQQRPLALLLDGQFWAESMPVWPALQAQTNAGALPPAVYVLIDAIDREHRAVELPCNDEFWLAVHDELLPLLREHVVWREHPSTTVVAGQSFGGLAALYAALTWPERFGCALSQSASCWWPNRADGNAPGRLEELMLAGLVGKQPVNIFMEAGIREPLIFRAHQRLVPLLRHGRHRLLWRQVEGGHDALCWRGGLLDGLIALWADVPAL